MKTSHATTPQGGLKKRATKKRVSIGTLPYQITRYCEKKKYIHMTDMAKVSLAMSWIPEGATLVMPRALARMVRKVTGPKPVYSALTTKWPPKRPLYKIGSSVITRSKAQRETTTTKSIRRVVASLFRRATASGVSAGAASWANTDLAKVMATQ